ncbi:MAG TPA: cell division topological specificity factor MinE [Aggregatilineales bacterium]|jgi:cell division topological specificity factor|nr:cell division topological specificity factor MinE [Anaerolineae bacterium]HUN08881.1 cell division topological specificity factor MinE [Aggregatilineales bacterium]
MTGFFERLFGTGGNKGSGAAARERLQFILVHDRINLPPEQLQAMKAEILAVISRYVSVNSEQVDIALQQRDRDSLLVAEIPFTKAIDTDEARQRMADPEKTDNNMDDA